MTYSPIHDISNPNKVEKDDLLTQEIKQYIKNLKERKK